MKTKFEGKNGECRLISRVACLFGGVIQPKREEKAEERLGESRNDTVWLLAYLSDNQHLNTLTPIPDSYPKLILTILTMTTLTARHFWDFWEFRVRQKQEPHAAQASTLKKNSHRKHRKHRKEETESWGTMILRFNVESKSLYSLYRLFHRLQ